MIDGAEDLEWVSTAPGSYWLIAHTPYGPALRCSVLGNAGARPVKASISIPLRHTITTTAADIQNVLAAATLLAVRRVVASVTVRQIDLGE